jgi:uncharacterized protein YdeI (YjbR/CyaY-like superfamily)
MDPVFFRSGADMRRWLERQHGQAAELLVGFYRTASGKPSITWAQAVDEALCFGWIDGVRKGRDADSYTIRFTPRQLRSTWSAVNIRRFGELEAMGRLHDSGRQAFSRRQESRSGIYSYEQREHRFSDDYERRFRGNRKAWEFFQAQAPSYRRTATHFVMSAKREETRERRLAELVKDSANGERLDQLSRYRSRGSQTTAKKSGRLSRS